ncbi:transposase [Erwinia tracheiphila PSU-1]|nr:transposase [Erwinia tracheiphila PSU-1]
MLPLSRVVAAANRHDIKLVAGTPGALQTGHPGQKPGLCPNKGDEAPGLKTDRLSRRDEPYRDLAPCLSSSHCPRHRPLAQ